MRILVSLLFLSAALLGCSRGDAATAEAEVPAAVSTAPASVQSQGSTELSPFTIAEHKIAVGDTIPTPEGLYTDRIEGCARVRDTALQQDFVACTARGGIANNIDLLQVQETTCEGLRQQYLKDGIDWKKHSDGAVFAADCEGKPANHPIFVQWSLEGGKALHRLRSGTWEAYSTLDAYLTAR